MLDRLITQGQIAASSRIYSIDDSSKDRSWNALKNSAVTIDT